MLPIDTKMHIFWKHPIAIVFLVFYTLLCINTVLVSQLVEARLKAHPDMSGIEAGGEWGGLFLLFMGSVFFLVSCCYAIGSKTETKFYLWLIGLIIIENIAALNIS
jgi:hypothetical protein